MREEKESTVDTLVSALRILSGEIRSDDGVANAAIGEAAGRLALLQEKSLAVLSWYYRVGDVGGAVELMEGLMKAAGVTEEWLCRK